MASAPNVEDQFQTISRICYPPLRARAVTRTIRPERPECSSLMGSEGGNATARQQAVIRLIYKSLGGTTGRRALEPLARNKRIITCLTAILFDQECSRSSNYPRHFMPTMDSAPWPSPMAPPLTLLSWSGMPEMRASLIEHMLLIDYGFGEHPLRSLGGEPTWMTNYMTRVVCHKFCKRLTKLADDCRSGKDIWHYRLFWLNQCLQSYDYKYLFDHHGDFSDMSLMFYFFWTRRHQISKDEYNRGLTGYDGVLDEMISEVPTVGTDRLTRKLSVDVTRFIPGCVKDKECQTEMIKVARRIAMEHGVVLQAPESAFEYLIRPDSLNNGSTPLRQVIMRQNRARHNDTEAFDRTPTPPPSYNEPTPPPSYCEAMGLPLFGGESDY